MVLKSLSNGEKTPYMIAEDCGLLPSNIYKTLRQLRDYGLISCRNPNITNGRIYMLTDKGKELVEILK